MSGFDEPTSFDVRFRIFGIPVSIQPMFWLTAALLVWDGDHLDRVLLGILCVLVSVLVHEFGHAVMARRYGFPSQIVLRMFGGYATTGYLPPNQQIITVAAGPGAGIILFALTDGLLFILSRFAPHVLIEYEGVQAVFVLMLFTNLIWSLMNLIPVIPMDGGLIMQAWFRKSRIRNAALRESQYSIGAAALVVGWALFVLQAQKNGNPILLVPLPEWLFPSGPLNPAAIVRTIQPDPLFFALMFGYLGVNAISAHQQRFGGR